jgi:hypothetical protein
MDYNEERAKAEWSIPMAQAIRTAGLSDGATPTDRLAMAVLILARQVHDTGVLLTTPIITTEATNL